MKNTLTANNQALSCEFSGGRLPFFSVTLLMKARNGYRWRWLGYLLSQTIPLDHHLVKPTIPKHLLGDKVGEGAVPSLVPLAALTFKHVLKPGTVGFLRVKAWHRVKQATGDHGMARQVLPHLPVRLSQGEQHGPCSQEGVAGTCTVPGSTAEQTPSDPSLHKQRRN